MTPCWPEEYKQNFVRISKKFLIAKEEMFPYSLEVILHGTTSVTVYYEGNQAKNEVDFFGLSAFPKFPMLEI